MNKVGLVLQGGGLRGVYTSGVIDFFLDKGIDFPYVAAVSAGACNGAAYIAKQRGFGKTMLTKYIGDKSYMGLKHLYKHGSFFNMDFIFDEAPKRVENFDFDSFYKSQQDFVVVASDCKTGKPVYLRREGCSDMFMAIRASSSLPYVSKIVSLDGMSLLDGGIVDPVPIRKSIEDGNEKHVVVLTGKIAHQKKSRLAPYLARKFYPEYKEFHDALCNGHVFFNEVLDYIQSLRDEKKVCIIEPSEDVKTRLIERDSSRLNYLYELGYSDAEGVYDQIAEYLGQHK